MLISWMLPWEIYITILCLNGTLSCVDFMDVTVVAWEIYITILCLNGTLSCVDFMDVIMGDIYNHTVFEWDTFMC